jgi:hypothetical protein
LTSLVKNIDKQLEGRQGIYVIFCNDDPSQTKQLQGWIAGAQLKHVVICKMGAGGPKAYQVSGEADLTVVRYGGNQVSANIALRKGELNEGKAKEILKVLTNK